MGINESELKIVEYKMNSLLLLHNKYHSNEKEAKKNVHQLLNPSTNNMEIENNNNTKIPSSSNKNNIFIDETEMKTNIEKSDKFLRNKNSNNNIITKDIINNSFNDKKTPSFFHSFNKPRKRSYLELLSQSKNDSNKKTNNNLNNTVINVNVNNNSYYYLNNRDYNINSEEKYGIDFSKKKLFKKY